MQRRTMVMTVAGGAVLVALLAWAFAPRPLEVEVAQAATGPFETAIVEDARTRLADRFVVAAPLAGRVQRIALREGDEVQAGDIVATLLPGVSPMLDARTVAEQRARVGVTEAGVQRATTRIEAARVALEQARNELRRSEQLAQQGFVSPTKIDNDRLAVMAAQKELDTAVEGQTIARHELTMARAALGAVTGAAGSTSFTLRAPVAGRVLKVHQASEGPVGTGTPLLEIGDITKLEVVAELLTTDALQTRPGGPVHIERWGGPGTLEGSVRRVEPAAFTKISALGVEEQRVNVLIELTSPHERWAALGDGYRVGVRIVTLAEPRVLRVPVSAVFPQPGSTEPGAMAVFVVDGGRARLQAVQVKARNGSEAWVSEGLAEGATVVVYPPAALADGARVKPRQV